MREGGEGGREGGREGGIVGGREGGREGGRGEGGREWGGGSNKKLCKSREVGGRLIQQRRISDSHANYPKLLHAPPPPLYTPCTNYIF